MDAQASGGVQTGAGSTPWILRRAAERRQEALAAGGPATSFIGTEVDEWVAEAHVSTVHRATAVRRMQAEVRLRQLTAGDDLAGGGTSYPFASGVGIDIVRSRTKARGRWRKGAAVAGIVAAWLVVSVAASPAEAEEPSVLFILVGVIGGLVLFAGLFGYAIWRMVSPTKWAEPCAYCGHVGGHRFKCPTRPPEWKRLWVERVLHVGLVGVFNALSDDDGD